MIMQKWNYEIRKYEPYEVPDDWKVSLYENDMDTIVNCAICGKEMTFGEGYTSRTIHSEYGVGYCICYDCYHGEWEQEHKRQVQAGMNTSSNAK